MRWRTGAQGCNGICSHQPFLLGNLRQPAVLILFIHLILTINHLLKQSTQLHQFIQDFIYRCAHSGGGHGLGSEANVYFGLIYIKLSWIYWTAQVTNLPPQGQVLPAPIASPTLTAADLGSAFTDHKGQEVNKLNSAVFSFINCFYLWTVSLFIIRSGSEVLFSRQNLLFKQESGLFLPVKEARSAGG